MGIMSLLSLIVGIISLLSGFSVITACVMLLPLDITKNGCPVGLVCLLSIFIVIAACVLLTVDQSSSVSCGNHDGTVTPCGSHQRIFTFQGSTGKLLLLLATFCIITVSLFPVSIFSNHSIEMIV